MRAARGLIAAVILSGLLSTVFAPAASAHARYTGSSPADRETVASAPSEVWAEFSEPPSGSSELQIFDPCGQRVDAGNTNATGFRLTVSMTSGMAGTFTVRYLVLSGADGHPTSGTFKFTASTGASCGDTGDKPSTKKDGPATGSSGDSAPDGETASSGGGADAEDGTRTGSGTGKAAAGKAPKGSGKKKDGAAQSKDASMELVLQDGGDDAAVPGDLPVDGLLIGLLLAALIGAAGGFVYAAILGPKRKP